MIYRNEFRCEQSEGGCINLFYKFLLDGFFSMSYKNFIMIFAGIILIFIGAGCMIDFRPLFERPYFLLFGLIAHSRIFVAALIGFLMLGNLIKECGVLEKLSKTAQNELSTIATLLLSLGIGATMSGACGLSSFPMASRTVQALAEDDQNFILMHAVSANISGQIGSLLIAGIIMQFLSIC